MRPPRDQEQNRIGARMSRYTRVGANIGSVAARMAGRQLVGGSPQDRGRAAVDLARALGGLKGPIMKVAQLLSTIPEAVPAEYASELAKLQSAAPPMGWAFVKRRMRAELGGDWQSRFQRFDHEAAASASLGQVHRALSLAGQALACKLQYPDMASAVEADLVQLDWLFAMHRRMDPAIDTSEMAKEIGARIREELDYEREAKHMRLYGAFLADEPLVRVPDVMADLSTRRLLTMAWLDGTPLLSHKEASLAVRNKLATAMFTAWWQPFCRLGVIHGDPHLGNYTVFETDGEPAGINLLDYGCIRIFPPRFVGGVIDLYEGLKSNDEARIVQAYETWGFTGLNRAIIDTLNVWARFIYAPLLDDRVRLIADGVKPGEYGRKEAYTVHAALKELGPIKVPREFVFMDRAAIGLGSVLIHLGAELNFHDLFNAAIAGFDIDVLAGQQAKALAAVALDHGSDDRL